MYNDQSLYVKRVLSRKFPGPYYYGDFVFFLSAINVEKYTSLKPVAELEILNLKIAVQLRAVARVKRLNSVQDAPLVLLSVTIQSNKTSLAVFFTRVICLALHFSY